MRSASFLWAASWILHFCEFCISRVLCASPQKAHRFGGGLMVGCIVAIHGSVPIHGCHFEYDQTNLGNDIVAGLVKNCESINRCFGNPRKPCDSPKSKQLCLFIANPISQHFSEKLANATRVLCFGITSIWCMLQF